VVAKEIEENIKSIIKKKKFKADRRLIIFLFFVVLSTIFWFLNRLEQEYTTEIRLPVRYINLPKDKILKNELPEYFSIEVKAHGYKLLEYKISNKFLPYIINVNSLTLRIHSRSDYTKLYTLPVLLKEDIESKLSSEFQIISILPDTLYFEFDERIYKKVKIVSQITAQPAAQYMLRGGIVLTPDSVTISGASAIVDSINNVFTVPENLLNLDKDYSGEVKLLKIDDIEFSTNSVDAKVDVEKFTEGSQKINITMLNVPDSLVLRIFPKEVTISYFVSLNDYDKISPQMFDAFIDFNDVALSGDMLKVKIANSPNYVQSLRYYPQQVEYIIEKK